MTTQQAVLTAGVIGAAGGIAGVLLTLLVQTLTGMRQRGLEKSLKTFDARLERYVDLVVEYEDMRQLSREMDKNEARKEEIDRIKDEHNSRAKEVQDRGYDKEDPDSMNEYSRELEGIASEINRNTEQRRKLEAQYLTLAEQTKDLTRRIAGTRAAIHLLSGRRVQVAIKKLDSEAGVWPNYKKPNLEPFLQAARKDMRIID